MKCRHLETLIWRAVFNSILWVQQGRAKKRNTFLSLGNRVGIRENLEEKGLEVNLKDGYELAKQKIPV